MARTQTPDPRDVAVSLTPQAVWKGGNGAFGVFATEKLDKEMFVAVAKAQGFKVSVGKFIPVHPNLAKKMRRPRMKEVVVGVSHQSVAVAKEQREKLENLF